MRFLGIDPGKSGGIACLYDDGSVKLCVPMKNLTEHDIVEVFRDAIAAEGVTGDVETFAVLEIVGGNRTAGRAQGGSTMFAFGRNDGILRGVTSSLPIRRRELSATKWQSHFGLLRKSKGETETDKKNRHKALAQQLYPGVKVTHAIADALLLATYGRQNRDQLF